MKPRRSESAMFLVHVVGCYLADMFLSRSSREPFRSCVNSLAPPVGPKVVSLR